jgi:hypothetical protein
LFFSCLQDVLGLKLYCITLAADTAQMQDYHSSCSHGYAHVVPPSLLFCLQDVLGLKLNGVTLAADTAHAS